ETFGTQVLNWWKLLNPTWRQACPSGEFLQSGEGDWGVLDVSGRNGLLSVLACMRWWHDLGAEDMNSNPQWIYISKDVSWVV
ncbi:hypothetical protein BT96DRAFT_740331, partial [Gymnopus androsaceus JB14]